MGHVDSSYFRSSEDFTLKLASVYGHVPSTRKFKPWNGWPLPECKIGLEWEFEHGTALRAAISQSKTNSYFVIHEDGSLRDLGVEIVTNGDGLFGEDLLSALNEISVYVNKTYPVCNYRTGFHVHLDIRDLEEKELHNLFILYCLLERPIFNFAGADRWKSNFCVPWFRADAQFPVLRQVETATTKNQGAVGFAIKNLQRYSALNCQSIAKFGTLEFRHLENSLDILGKQADFIRIVMLLKKMAVDKYSQGYHGEALFEYLKRQTPGELLRDFGWKLPTQDWDYPESLMHAVELVNFKQAEPDFFHDAVFERFVGTHPNYK